MLYNQKQLCKDLINNVMQSSDFADTFVIDGVTIKGFRSSISVDRILDYFGMDSKYAMSIVISANDSPVVNNDMVVTYVDDRGISKNYKLIQSSDNGKTAIEDMGVMIKLHLREI